MTNVLRLEVVGGSLKGQSVVVPDGGMLTVGRLPDCGLSLAQDMTVSRQHFRIEFQFPNCQFTHLSQTSESLINDRSAINEELRSGDVITFGAGNRVRVIIEETGDVSKTPTVVPGASLAETSSAPKQFSGTKATCGWFQYESLGADLGFAEVLAKLVENYSLAAIVDFRRIEKPVPADLADPQYLFSWIPEATRNQFSPIIVSLKSNPVVAELLPESLGKNGFICFASKLKGAELASFWRKVIGASDQGPGQSMTAYNWPVVLNMILTCQNAIDVEPLLKGLDWIFLESPKSPGKWRLFSKVDFESELIDAGYSVAKDQTTVS